MEKTNFFFCRRRFEIDAVGKPFYDYLGYYEQGTDNKHYPVKLAFGKNQIDILYVNKRDGRTDKMFSFYVAEGEINQTMLIKQIEDYWLMPRWPLNKDIHLCVDKTLLSMSYFSSWHEFDFDEESNHFLKCSLFSSRRDDILIKHDELQFNFGLTKDVKKKDVWYVESCESSADKYIVADAINFRKIILDVLFELDYANTFEDENFFELQPALQNNKLLDSISRKCRYLDELYKRRDYERAQPEEHLPKNFLDAELAWLKTCFDDTYRSVFASAKSIFETVEKEAEAVTFRSQIGKARLQRRKYFVHDKSMHDDSNLRNQLATFFLRQYSLFNAFNVLIPKTMICALPIILLLIPFGDFGLLLFKAGGVGLFSIGLPLIIVVGLIVFYWRNRINLFKLLLPRMSLGILMGWSIFWSSADLWKASLTMSAGRIALIVILLFVILLFYIFTDIRNKLIRVADKIVARRAVALIGFAALMSLLQGFYIIQLFGEPMFSSDYQSLQTSNPILFDFNQKAYESDIDKKYEEQLSKIKIPEKEYAFLLSKKDDEKKSGPAESGTFSALRSKWLKGDNRDWLNYEYNVTLGNNSLVLTFRYMWPVLLSQFMISILIGIVLQLLWEDRPITEPL